MAQRFLRFFGQSRTQKAVYEALKEFLSKNLKDFKFQNEAIAALSEMAQKNISNKTKNEESEKFIENLIKKEDSKENARTQNDKNGWCKRNWGSSKKGLSTYNFLKQFCDMLANTHELKQDSKKLKNRLSKSAAINTRKSLTLIDKIAEEIFKKNASNNVMPYFIVPGFVSKKIKIEIDDNTKINEIFFIQKLKYSKKICSGIKIELDSKNIFEIKNEDLNTNKKLCKNLFKSFKIYYVYYLMNCSVEIEGRKDENKLNFYTNETYKGIYLKLQKEFSFSDESKLSVNEKKFSQSDSFCDLIDESSQQKIFITTTKEIYTIEFKDEEIEIEGTEDICELEKRIRKKFGFCPCWKIFSDKEEKLNFLNKKSSKSQKMLIKNVFIKKEKYILKTSETYKIESEKIEINLNTQLSIAIINFRNLKSIGKRSSYKISGNNDKKVMVVEGGKKVFPEEDLLCCEIFNEKEEYKVVEIERKGNYNFSFKSQKIKIDGSNTIGDLFNEAIEKKMMDQRDHYKIVDSRKRVILRGEVGKEVGHKSGQIFEKFNQNEEYTLKISETYEIEKERIEIQLFNSIEFAVCQSFDSVSSSIGRKSNYEILDSKNKTVVTVKNKKVIFPEANPLCYKIFNEEEKYTIKKQGVNYVFNFIDTKFNIDGYSTVGELLKIVSSKRNEITVYDCYKIIDSDGNVVSKNDVCYEMCSRDSKQISELFKQDKEYSIVTFEEYIFDGQKTKLELKERINFHELKKISPAKIKDLACNAKIMSGDEEVVILRDGKIIKPKEDVKVYMIFDANKKYQVVQGV